MDVSQVKILGLGKWYWKKALASPQQIFTIFLNGLRTSY